MFIVVLAAREMLVTFGFIWAPDKKARAFSNFGEICLSGAQMGLNHEKNGSKKSRDTLPLKEQTEDFCVFLRSFSNFNLKNVTSRGLTV